MARIASKIYVPLDVSFFDDDKIIDVGEKSGWLFLNMMTRAKALDSDGELSIGQMSRLGISDWKKRITALIDAELIELRDDVYCITSWLQWNESSQKRRERLEKDRKNKVNRALKPTLELVERAAE